MKYALFIYEDESVYGPGKDNHAVQQIVAKHVAFNKELDAAINIAKRVPVLQDGSIEIRPLLGS